MQSPSIFQVAESKKVIRELSRMTLKPNCQFYSGSVHRFGLYPTLGVTIYLVRGPKRAASHQAMSPDSSGRDQRLDQHRFRPLGKLVVGNLDRIADVDNVGN